MGVDSTGEAYCGSEDYDAEQCLRFARPAVLGAVVEFDYAAGPLFRGVDHAGIKGIGINVQADRALIELTRVGDTMHRFLRIDRTRM